ncbi:MAG: calcium-binding protein [Pseudomonadota bacterium]|nr:calcium-binding protein [Pseudomonadota bacterium]
MGTFRAYRAADMVAVTTSMMLTYKYGEVMESSTTYCHIHSTQSIDSMDMRGSFPSTGLPTTGTLSQLVFDDLHSPKSDLAAYAVSMTVEEFVGFVQSNNALGLLERMFGGSDVITGSSWDDVLYGFAGDDLLDGAGGADSMSGGSGNDSYFVDLSDDKVVESSSSGGTDQVTSSVSFILGEHVENLTLTGTLAINGTGNGLANRLDGNGAANILEGGVGADVMAGGGGDDLFLIDNANDQVVEAALGGIDTVNSSVSHSLAAQVENLNLVGASALNGTGNALDNVITGNGAGNSLKGGSGKDTLNGGGGNDVLDGGTDVDTMRGGAGNDTYFIDNALDRIEETATTGSIDLARTSVSYVLGTGVRVETLSALNPAGTTAINLTGNEFANTIEGNNGANLLLGKGQSDVLRGKGGADNLQGGAGADKLYGGTGKDVLRGDDAGAPQAIDRFFFDTALNATTNVDTIRDFNGAYDFIHLSQTVFKGIGTALDRDELRIVGVDTPDGEDRIIYNPATGALLFDRDGTGTTYGAIQFAVLENKPAVISNADFVIFG